MRIQDLIAAALLALAGCSETHIEPDRSAMLRDDLETLRAALARYEADHGRAPESLDEMVRPDAEGHHYLPGGTPMTFDPWGRRYEYELGPDGRPRVRSLGRDGVPGGTGADADVGFERLGE